MSSCACKCKWELGWLGRTVSLLWPWRGGLKLGDSTLSMFAGIFMGRGRSLRWGLCCCEERELQNCGLGGSGELEKFWVSDDNGFDVDALLMWDKGADLNCLGSPPPQLQSCPMAALRGIFTIKVKTPHTEDVGSLTSLVHSWNS